MVYSISGASSTYWCACGEGTLLRQDGSELGLTEEECRWLDRLEPELTEFLYGQAKT